MRLSLPFKLISVFPFLLIMVTGFSLLGSQAPAYAAVARSQHPMRAGIASPTSTLPCGAWTVVPSANTGISSSLAGVAAVSANDVWSVGSYKGSSSSSGQTLIEHWDGTSWSIVTSPSPSTYSNLKAIAAVSANDIWAVGSSSSETLTEHWDGSSWSVIPSPNVSSSLNYLASVAVVASNDVWAVGESDLTDGDAQTLTEHWDGTSWSIIPSPNVATFVNAFIGVAAIATNDVWAVGTSEDSGSQPLIEHWDGNSWSVIPSPVPSIDGILYGVSAVSANNIWAVGHFISFSVEATLIEHWDGTSWSIVPSPNPRSSDYLTGVTASPAGAVWTAGHDINLKQSAFQTLIEHWIGTKWQASASPNVGTQNNALYAIAQVPGTKQLWTVGLYDSGHVHQTLIEFRC